MGWNVRAWSRALLAHTPPLPQAVQRFFSDKILGLDWIAPSPDIDYKEGDDDDGASFLAWCGDDVRQIDAVAANTEFHREPAILQRSEFVEMAFKGRRDMVSTRGACMCARKYTHTCARTQTHTRTRSQVLFTNKRMLSLDVKGWFGKGKKKKKSFLSVPWSTVKAFAVRCRAHARTHARIHA